MHLKGNVRKRLVGAFECSGKLRFAAANSPIKTILVVKLSFSAIGIIEKNIKIRDLYFKF